MAKFASAALLCALMALVGCSGMPPPRQATVCSTQPGSFACQVERYSNAGM